MIFLTKQEKQEYIYAQAMAENTSTNIRYFHCPVCNKSHNTIEKATECCADFDDEEMK